MTEFITRPNGQDAESGVPRGTTSRAASFHRRVLCVGSVERPKTYLTASRKITAAAASPEDVGVRPIVLDPFAGGGSIPLEALRVGAEAVATDFNPLPVLLNRILVDFIPKYGRALGDDLVEAARHVHARAEPRLKETFPVAHRGQPPVAYLWARQIHCEGPGCGVTVPIIRSPILAKRGRASVGLELSHDKRAKAIKVAIVSERSTFGNGTVRGVP